MTPAFPPPRVSRSLRPHDPDAAARLHRALGVPDAVARVLAARGFVSPEQARAWLEPRPDALHDPLGMGGMPEAVELLAGAARRGGRVVVFGDYDCDGIGALAILTTTLKRLGADAIPFVPHRLRDGYGLRPETLRRVLDEHAPEGVVTVDCGITAVDPIREAVERGVFVVVTDHHLPPEELPKRAVLLNPKIPGCPYPFKDLAGAGIAWKLCEALLRADGPRVGVAAPAVRPWMASLAKVAALSTIADMVPLTGENRVLTAWGLQGLAEPRSPGLSALLARCSVRPGKSPSVHDVAFRIAPRLNASGRIDHAFRALELLTTADADRASALADEIEAANTERRRMQEKVVASALARIERTFDPARDALVLEAGTPDEGWHRGVLGIAASRVAHDLARPVLLLAREDGRVGGSGRTWGRTPLYERIAPVARRHGAEFGGHHAALGLSIAASGYEAFREEAQAAFAAARDEEEWSVVYEADTELEPGEVTPELVDALARLEPHGIGNPRPLFLLRSLSWDGRGRPVGEKGLRVGYVRDGVRLEAVGWSLGTVPGPERRGTWDVLANVSHDAFLDRPALTVLDAIRAEAA
ncbi:MAG: single-stranded-DNA-specific exonuclease RecJ [Thermoanaerobaculia bacterium]